MTAVFLLLYIGILSIFNNMLKRSEIKLFLSCLGFLVFIIFVRAFDLTRLFTYSVSREASVAIFYFLFYTIAIIKKNFSGKTFNITFEVLLTPLFLIFEDIWLKLFCFLSYLFLKKNSVQLFLGSSLFLFIFLNRDYQLVDSSTTTISGLVLFVIYSLGLRDLLSAKKDIEDSFLFGIAFAYLFSLPEFTVYILGFKANIYLILLSYLFLNICKMELKRLFALKLIVFACLCLKITLISSVGVLFLYMSSIFLSTLSERFRSRLAVGVTALFLVGALYIITNELQGLNDFYLGMFISSFLFYDISSSGYTGVKEPHFKESLCE